MEVTRLSEDTKELCLESNLKEIKSLINNKNFLVEEPEKGESMTPCMDVYKDKIQSDGSIDKLKLRNVVGGDLQNKELFGETWSPTSSMRTFKYFSADDVNHNAIMHQLNFIRAFLHAEVKNRVFVKLDSIYADYLQNI